MIRPTPLNAVALVALFAAAPIGATVPAGFSDTLVASVGAPVGLAFLPDGRLLVTTQGGSLRVVSGGVLLATPALTIPASGICTDSERGMLGVAVDPAYPVSPYLYVYYTANTAGGCVNRLSRFTLADGSDTVTPASELVLVDNMPSVAGNHNAGDVKFGPDGTLFATVGDGGCDYAGDSGCGGANDASRDPQTLTGKLLRVGKDGSIPSDNPFQGAGTARCNVTGRTTAGNKCQETYAWGFRNPFRFTFDPNAAGLRLFVNDVGQNAWEEIDDVAAGGDYGWNCREGRHVNNTMGPCSPTPPNLIDPIFEYPHGAIPGTSLGGCGAITGGAFVPNGLWPGFDGAYLAADLNCGGIFKLTESAGTWSAADFGSGFGGSSLVTLLFGPWNATQALYYTTYAGGGQVRRIDRPPPPPAAARYHTVTPCRAYDSRTAGSPLAAGTPRNLALAGPCGVPPGAAAVAANVTVTQPAAAGSLTALPAGVLSPATAAVSFHAGQTRANNAVLSLLGAPAGVVTFTPAIPSGTLHLVIDVTGYFQ